MKDYGLLKDIYWGDIEKITSLDEKQFIGLSEAIYSVDCYRTLPNELSFDIAKLIVDKYVTAHPQELNDLVHLLYQSSGIHMEFLSKLDNPAINNFIAQCPPNKTEVFMDNDLKLNEIQNSDISKINTLIELDAFNKVLTQHISIEDVDNIVEMAKKVATAIIEKNINKPGLYSSAANLLPSDVVDSLVSNMNRESTLSADLWANIERYTLEQHSPFNIQHAPLETISDMFGPHFLQQNTKEPIYEATWVLLENGNLYFASTSYDSDRLISHIDIANGEPVVSGGMAYFSSDKKKLLAIDNRSGHYFPSIDSVSETIPIFEKNNYDIEDAVISDYNWENAKKFKPAILDNIKNKILSIREKSSNNPSHNIKTPKKSS